jgi:hypothetical protein
MMSLLSAGCVSAVNALTGVNLYGEHLPVPPPLIQLDQNHINTLSDIVADGIHAPSLSISLTAEARHSSSD